MKQGNLRAVEDVSFFLDEGELLGIVGESGCGKSTLARVISGALPPTSGETKLNGVDYYRLKGTQRRAFRRNIQMVFQDPLSSFSPRMRIGTYMIEPMRNYQRTPKGEALARAAELLERVGLTAEYLSRYPHELSGGQLQRVAIARAIAVDPPLLICDEATGALDVSIQNQIAKLLVSLVEEKNIGCVFIGHDLALVRSVSQRVMVMYLGRIVEILKSERLEQESVHPYTRALLDAVLDVYCDPREPLRLLQGEPPSATRRFEGCAFSARCPRCAARCKEERPGLRALDGGHWVACHAV